MLRIIVMSSVTALAASSAVAVVEPAKCPIVVDSAGRSLGSLIDTGGTAIGTHVYWLDEEHAGEATTAKVALSIDGRVLLFTVHQDRLIGTLPPDDFWLAFDGPDCTGNAYVRTDLSEPRGPLAATVVWGPNRRAFVVDLGSDAGFTRRSWASLATDGCYNSAAYATWGHPTTAVADLAPEFTPPFSVQDGPCPWPGGGRGGGGGGGRP